MHHLILRHHRMIIILATVLTVLAAVACAQLKLDLNFLSLLPDNAHTRTFMQAMEKIGLHSIMTTAVQTPEGVDPQLLEPFIDLLAEKYRTSHLIQKVDAQRTYPDLNQLFPILLQHLPHLLDSEDMQLLAQQLSDTQIRKTVQTNKKILLTPFGVASKQMALMDPLDLSALLQKRFALPSESPIPQQVNDTHDYFRTDQGLFFIFSQPINAPQDVSFSKRLMQEVLLLENEALIEIQNSHTAFPLDLEIRHTGGYPIAVNDEALTKNDIQITLATSVTGVLLLFGLCFRTLKTLVHVGLPLAMSILWTLGLATLIFGHLNLLTCIFSCVLAALGIDFAIHLVNRFYSPNNNSDTLNARLQSTFKETVPAITIGALTTASAFLAIGLSDFRGFRELGLVTGIGILLCLVAMLLVLPALMVRSHSNKKRARKITISRFGLLYLMKWLSHRPKTILIVVLILTIVLALLGTHIQFDDNLKNFRPADDQALALQEQITKWLGGSSATSLLVIKGDDESTAADTAAAAIKALQPLQDQGKIAGILALQSFLPAPRQQYDNLKFVRAHPSSFDINRIRKTFSAALADNGLEALPVYDNYLDTLDRALKSTSPVLPSDLAASPLGSMMRRFFYHDNTQIHMVIHVRPPQDLWSRADAGRFKQSIETQLAHQGISEDQYILTGPQLLSAQLRTLIMQNLRFALILAVAVIIGILALYYRSLLLLAGALTPLAASLAAMTGIMFLGNMDFNFINIIVLPMIVGIGIDDGVHLTNTYLQCSKRFIPHAVSRTSRGMVLTSLTTMVGFGSISLSHYPGLKSTGYIALIGVGACLLTSLFLLSPLLVLMEKQKNAAFSLP